MNRWGTGAGFLFAHAIGVGRAAGLAATADRVSADSVRPAARAASTQIEAGVSGDLADTCSAQTGLFRNGA